MKRRRGLTPEEDALWRKAMRDVAPMGRKKPSLEGLVSPSQPSVSSASHGASSAGLLPPRRRTIGIEPRTLQHRTDHPFLAGDPRLERLAGRGRLPIDAVLDLHGHNQRTARSTLQRFVAQAHANGARCLLVITGKGAPVIAGQTIEAHTTSAGRGILRARFADWLEEPPLRQLVSRASPAHQRHGGAGAFYIFLKR